MHSSVCCCCCCCECARIVTEQDVANVSLWAKETDVLYAWLHTCLYKADATLALLRFLLIHNGTRCCGGIHATVCWSKPNNALLSSLSLFLSLFRFLLDRHHLNLTQMPKTGPKMCRWLVEMKFLSAKKKKENPNNQTNKKQVNNTQFFHVSWQIINLFSISASPALRAAGTAGAYRSCLGAALRPGQVAGLSQGHIERMNHSHLHPLLWANFEIPMRLTCSTVEEAGEPRERTRTDAGRSQRFRW